MRKSACLFLAFLCTLTLTIGLLTPVSYAKGDIATAWQWSVVGAGAYHSAVVDVNHVLWVWGSNRYGQIGNNGAYNSVYVEHRYITHADGTTTDQPREYRIQTTPVKVLEDVVSVSCGAYFTAAIKSDGTLWMWGYNDMGQLGTGTTYSEYTPVQVLDQVAAVSCGYSHTAAIRYDGSLWVWGHNGYDQLGTNGIVNGQRPGWENDQLPIQTTPVKIMDRVSTVSCGNWHTAAIKTDGGLWIWGRNVDFKGLGAKDTGTQATPIQVRSNVKSVCCGDECTIVTSKNGTLAQYGSYEYIPMFQRTDTAVINWGSEWHCAALCTDGSLWVRGHDYSVFDSTFHKAMDNVYDVACGSSHILSVKSDGSVWAWGFNGYGQIGNDGLGGKPKNSVWASYSAQPLQEAPYRLNITAAVPDVVNVPVADPIIGGFTDVRQSSYYADAVLWAVENNITSGTSATTFSPNATCTKAQILTFLWRAKGRPDYHIANPFSNIDSSSYYYGAALWAYEQGLITGDTFSPDTPCTRSTTMLYFWDLAGRPDATSSSFIDVSADANYAPAVAWAVRMGITSGTGNNQFSPDAICTRGQIVTFLYRYLVEFSVA